MRSEHREVGKRQDKKGFSEVKQALNNLYNEEETAACLSSFFVSVFVQMREFSIP